MFNNNAKALTDSVKLKMTANEDFFSFHLRIVSAKPTKTKKLHLLSFSVIGRIH